MHANVRDYGVAGDGYTKDTEAFRNAIAACDNTGGGTLVVPAGHYLTDPLELCSHLTLHLESGAVLWFAAEFSQHPIVATRWAGFMCHSLQACVFGDGLEDVAITGRGVLDGQGQYWWDEFRAMKNESSPAVKYEFERQLAQHNSTVNTEGAIWDEWTRQFLRPPLFELKDCRNVAIEGVTLRNSPFWNTHLLFCEDATVHNVRFENPADAPNADGLDIDSSCRVRVSDCTFDVGDDCLCLKSGIDETSRQMDRPTEDVAVTNCTMYRGHGGVVMGSDTAAGIRNVAISNCIFHETDRGIRIKSRRGRGGGVEDIQVQNIVMTDVTCPFVMNLYYTCGTSPAYKDMIADPAPRAVDETTPQVRGITLSNITARRASVAAGALIGLPEAPIRDVTLRDVRIDTVQAGNPAQAAMSFQCPRIAGGGFMARHTGGLTLLNVTVHAVQGHALDVQDSTDTHVEGGRFTSQDETVASPCQTDAGEEV